MTSQKKASGPSHLDAVSTTAAAEKTVCKGTENNESRSKRCEWCGDEVLLDEDDAVMTVCCAKMCEDAYYHERCLESYKQSHLKIPNSKSVFPCPRGKSGKSQHDSCKGYVQRVIFTAIRMRKKATKSATLHNREPPVQGPTTSHVTNRAGAHPNPPRKKAASALKDQTFKTLSSLRFCTQTDVSAEVANRLRIDAEANAAREIPGLTFEEKDNDAAKNRKKRNKNARKQHNRFLQRQSQNESDGPQSAAASKVPRFVTNAEEYNALVGCREGSDDSLPLPDILSETDTDSEYQDAPDAEGGAAMTSTADSEQQRMVTSPSLIPKLGGESCDDIAFGTPPGLSLPSDAKATATRVVGGDGDLEAKTDVWIRRAEEASRRVDQISTDLRAAQNAFTAADESIRQLLRARVEATVTIQTKRKELKQAQAEQETATGEVQALACAWEKIASSSSPGTTTGPSGPAVGVAAPAVLPTAIDFDYGVVDWVSPAEDADAVIDVRNSAAFARLRKEDNAAVGADPMAVATALLHRFMKDHPVEMERAPWKFNKYVRALTEFTTEE